MSPEQHAIQDVHSHGFELSTRVARQQRLSENSNSAQCKMATEGLTADCSGARIPG